jgi:hypothetical protein
MSSRPLVCSLVCSGGKWAGVRGRDAAGDDVSRGARLATRHASTAPPPESLTHLLTRPPGDARRGSPSARHASIARRAAPQGPLLARTCSRGFLHSRRRRHEARWALAGGHGGVPGDLLTRRWRRSTFERAKSISATRSIRGARGCSARHSHGIALASVCSPSCRSCSRRAALADRRHGVDMSHVCQPRLHIPHARDVTSAGCDIPEARAWLRLERQTRYTEACANGGCKHASGTPADTGLLV